MSTAPKILEYSRKVGSVPGSTIDDLVALHKCVILCTKCAFKFGDPKKRQYHKPTRFPFVDGTCDDCRSHDRHARFYVWQGSLTDGDGRSNRFQSELPE